MHLAQEEKLTNKVTPSLYENSFINLWALKSSSLSLSSSAVVARKVHAHNGLPVAHYSYGLVASSELSGTYRPQQ